VSRFNGIACQRWLIPGLSATLLLVVLVIFFPFDSGYSTVRHSLSRTLWSTWTGEVSDGQDYTYCIWVPVMVAYVLYERASRIAQAPVRGVTGALVLILLGLVLFWIGSRAGKQYIGCVAIEVVLAGCILWFWGVSVFRLLLFAWAILAFAWPLPFIDTAVAFPMRMTVSHVAFHALNLLGIPSVQNGTALVSAPNAAMGLQLGDRFQIDVADPCSGLHSLLPLLMFSAFFGYFFLKRPWQQWTVFLSAIPFAIIGNVVRILLLVIGCITWGASFALGTNEVPSAFHEGCGFAVFVVVLGLECLLGFLLLASARSAKGASLATSVPASATGKEESAPEVPRWRSGIMLALTAVMLVVSWNSPPPVLTPEAGVMMSLPDVVTLPGWDGGHFLGLNAPVSEAEQTILPKDTEFARKNYDDFHGHTVFFSIVLSGLQQYTIHPPQVCLVAQGWSIVNEENVRVHLASGRDMEVRNLTIQREEVGANQQHRMEHALYMYWYVADGISTPSRDTRNWLSSWDRVFHNRDHRWAYVIAMAPITESTRQDGLNAGQTRKLLTDFISEVVPTFQKSEMPGLSRN